MGLSKKLTAIADGFRSSGGTTAKLSLEEMAALAANGGAGLIEDKPTTPGQWACLARASQMRDITYQVQAEMPAAYDYAQMMYPGIDYTGLIYSSVRATEWGFIGYGTSIYSYLTALHNPRSIAYTRKYPDYFPNPDGQANVSNVFGTNCSEFVSYCLDRPYLGTTGTLPLLPNMIRLCEGTDKMTDFDALRNELQLCDLAGGIIEHIEIVTGIRRNKKGVIQEVELSDSWPPRIQKITYTWDEFVQHCGVKYNYPFLRYADLDKVTFPENLTGMVYSDICTSRGDKVCIRPDQDISLNVLVPDGYAGIALFRDGVLIETHPITADAPNWELIPMEAAEGDGMPAGKYTAILYRSGEAVTIESATDTNSTSFIVCAVSLEKAGNVYTYTAEAVEGVYPTPMQIALKDAKGFTKRSEAIDGEGFAGSGSIEVVASAVPGIVHLPFRTEYGFVIAEWIAG